MLLDPQKNYDPSGSSPKRYGKLLQSIQNSASPYAGFTIGGGDNVEAAAYHKYGWPYVSGRDNDMWRAQSQSGWEQLGNGLRRTGAELTLGTLKGLSDIPDVFRALASEGGLANLAYDDFRNEISKALQGRLDAQREATPIYTTPDEEGFNPFKAAWWANNMASLASGVTMLLPTLGAAKAASWAARAIGALSKTKYFTSSQTALLGSVVGAAYGNLHESYMESVELGPKLYSELYTKYSQEMSPEQADAAAKAEVGERLAEQWRINAPNMLLDMIGVYSLMKPFKLTDGIITKSITGSLKKEVLPEGIQEFVNQYSSNLAQAKVDLITGVRGDNYTLREFFSDPNTYTAGFFGALGGTTFVAGGNFMNQVLENVSNPEAKLFQNVGNATFSGYTTKERERRGLQQEELTKLASKKAQYEQLKSTAELVGNKELYEDLQSLAAIDDAVDHMELGTFGRYVKFIEGVEKTVEELETNPPQAEPAEDGTIPEPINVEGLQEVKDNLTRLKNEMLEARTIYERGALRHNLTPGTRQLRLYTKYEHRNKKLGEKLDALRSSLNAVYAEDEYGVLRSTSNKQIEAIQKEIDTLNLGTPNVLPYEEVPLTEKQKKDKLDKIEALQTKLSKITPKNDSAAKELEIANLGLEKSKLNMKVKDIIDGTYEKKLAELAEEFEEISNIADEGERTKKSLYFMYKYENSDLFSDIENKIDSENFKGIGTGLLSKLEQLEQENLLGKLLSKKFGIDLNKHIDDGNLDNAAASIEDNKVDPEAAKTALEKLNNAKSKLTSEEGNASIVQEAINNVKDKSADNPEVLKSINTIEQKGINNLTEEDFMFNEEAYDKIIDEVNKIISTRLKNINNLISKINNSIGEYTIKTKQELYDSYFKNMIDSYFRGMQNVLDDKTSLLLDIADEAQKFVDYYAYMLEDPKLPEEIKIAIKNINITALKDKISEVFIEIESRKNDEELMQNARYSNWFLGYSDIIEEITGEEINTLKDLEEALLIIRNNKELQAGLQERLDNISESLFTSLSSDGKLANFGLTKTVVSLEGLRENPGRFLRQIILYENIVTARLNKEFEISGNPDDLVDVPGVFEFTEVDKRNMKDIINIYKILTFSKNNSNIKDAFFNFSDFYNTSNLIPFKEQLTAIFEGVMWYHSEKKTAFLSGVAGAGKSKVVVKGIIKSLGLKDSEVATIGETKRIDEIIKLGLFGEDTNSKGVNDYTLEELKEYLKDKKILVIDEAPRLSRAQIVKLNQAVNELDIKIILTGDPHQYKKTSVPEAVVPKRLSELDYDPFSNDIHYLPTLSIPLRVTNGEIADFQKIFQKAGGDNVFESQKFLHKHDSKHTQGVAISHDDDSFIFRIKEHLKNNEDFVVITTSEKRGKYISLGVPEDKVHTVESSQGDDWNSVFIDIPYSKDYVGGTYADINEILYTATSRSKNYINLRTNDISRIETNFTKEELNTQVTTTLRNAKIAQNIKDFLNFVSILKEAYGVSRGRTQESTKEEKEKEDNQEINDDGEITSEVEYDDEGGNTGEKVSDTTKEGSEQNVNAEEAINDLLNDVGYHKELMDSAEDERSSKEAEDDFFNEFKKCKEE